MTSAAASGSSLPSNCLSAWETQLALIGTALALLDQCATLLDTVLSTSSQLAFESLLMPGATIGKHLRHILDHYRLLLDAAEDPSAGEVNYDRRVRLTGIETQLDEATNAVQALQKRLRALEESPHEWLGRRMTLTAVTPEEVQLETTCRREMWFITLHAIHHLASIRVIAVGELDLNLPSDFGLAPSTALSRRAAQPPPTPTDPTPTSPSKL